MTIQKLETRYGTMFVPDNDQGQYWWLVNTGVSPEDDFIEQVCNLLKERPKCCAVDVGANFGCWTMALAKVKVAHTVVAIEPQACIHSLLSRSIAASGYRNVELLRLAAGDRSGLTQIAALDIDQAMNFGGIELEKKYHGDGHWTLGDDEAPMEAVSMQKLDVVLMGYMVSFIKIDVEGFEQKVLEGAKHTIERCRPILFVEMDHPRTNKEALREQILSYDYAIDEKGGNYLGLPL